MPDSEYDRLRAVSPEDAKLARRHGAHNTDVTLDALSRRLRELLEDRDRMGSGLQQLAVAGDDIREMAPHFIASGDVNSLRNYGANIASIARHHLLGKSGAIP